MSKQNVVQQMPHIGGERHSFAPLGALQRYPAFRYIWGSNFFFFTGTWMQSLVMSWVAYELTKSTFLLALFVTVRMLPMLLGPVGGLLSERMDRIKLMSSTLVVTIIATLIVAMLAQTGRLEYWHLLVTGLMFGFGQAPVQPARTTLIMDIVGRKDASNAIAINTIALDITRIFGPAIGGIVIGSLGSAPALWIGAVCYVVAGLFLIPIRHIGKGQERRGGNPVREFADGFKLIFRNRVLLGIVSISLSCNLFVWSAYQAFMPVFAKDVLGKDASGLGLLFMAAGVGALFSAIVVATININRKALVYVGGTAIFGLFYALFALSTSFPLSLLLMGVAGFGSGIFGVMQSTLLLLLVPPEMRGRAMGVQVLAIAILPIATLVHGTIADSVGVAPTAFVSGLLCVVNMAALLVIVPKLRQV